jgi:thioredoxin 1
MRNLISIVYILFGLIKCESNPQQAQQESSTIESALYQQKMDEAKDFQLIDVRTSGEFDEEHLVNALNMDYNGDDFSNQIGTLDKSKPTFIYCLSGGRSGSALQSMLDKGFKTVYNLKGGILQWKGDNMKLTAANDAPAWKGMSKSDYLNMIPDEMDVIVDFRAKWCYPCKQIKPILESIEKEYNGKLKVMFVDIDEHKSLAEDMRIKEIPYMIYYQKGKQTNVLTGIQTKKEILKAFDL